MTAREDLLSELANYVAFSEPPSTYEQEAVELFERIRAEVLREALAAIRPDEIGYGGPDHHDAFMTAYAALLSLAEAPK